MYGSSISPPPGHSRPRGWAQLGPALVLVCLGLLLIGAWFLASALPETPNLMDKRWGGRVQTEWDPVHGHFAILFLLGSLAVSLSGTVLHRLMGARRGDANRHALTLMGILAAVASIYCWWVAPVH